MSVVSLSVVPLSDADWIMMIAGDTYMIVVVTGLAIIHIRTHVHTRLQLDSSTSQCHAVTVPVRSSALVYATFTLPGCWARVQASSVEIPERGASKGQTPASPSLH